MSGPIEMPAGEISPRRRAPVTLHVVALALLALSAFVVGAAFGVRGADLGMLALALLMLVLGPVPILLDQRRPPGQRHLFLSLFALVFVVHYALPVFTYYLPAKGPVDAPGMARTALTQQDVIRGQLAALLGYLSLLAGYASPATRLFASAVPRLRRDWSPLTTMGAGIALIPIGIVITFLGQTGAIPRQLGTGVIGVFALGYVYANCLLTLVILRHGWRLPIVILAANLVFSVLWGVMTGRKQQILISPAMVVLTAAILRNRLRMRWVVAGALAVALVYPVSVFVKNELGSRTAENVLNPVETLKTVGSFVTSTRPAEYFVEGMIALGSRTDALGVTSVLVRDTPERSPYQYGRTLGLFFVSFVPRGMWPDKPTINTGLWITATYGSGEHIQSSTGPTQVGEWFVNFGWPGVAMGMLLLGFIMRLVQEKLLRHPTTVPGVVLGVILLFQLAVKFQGAVAGTYSHIVFLLAPIVAFHWALRILGATRVVSAEEPRRMADRPGPAPAGIAPGAVR
jgi:hypothetical protein